MLKKTGDYISSMQQKIAKHQSEINELKNQNTELEVRMQRVYTCLRICMFFFYSSMDLEANLLNPDMKMLNIFCPDFDRAVAPNDSIHT